MTLAVEGLERNAPANPHNFTDDELHEKAVQLKQMKELYPTVPDYYAELIWDMCRTKTQEEIDVIKNNVLTIPSKHPVPSI